MSSWGLNCCHESSRVVANNEHQFVGKCTVPPRCLPCTNTSLLIETAGSIDDLLTPAKFCHSTAQPPAALQPTESISSQPAHSHHSNYVLKHNTAAYSTGRAGAPAREPCELEELEVESDDLRAVVALLGAAAGAHMRRLTVRLDSDALQFMRVCVTPLKDRNQDVLESFVPFETLYATPYERHTLLKNSFHPWMSSFIHSFWDDAEYANWCRISQCFCASRHSVFATRTFLQEASKPCRT